MAPSTECRQDAKIQGMPRKDEIDLEDEELDAEELAELQEVDRSGGVIGFIGGLMLGAVIGAGIALLVAPERGEVTRRRLRARLDDLRDDAREHLEELRDEAGDQLRRRRRQIKRRLKSRT